VTTSPAPIPDNELVPWWEWQEGKRPPGWTDKDEAEWRGETTSSPTSSPPRPQVTSSLVPTPYGGDEDEHLVPDLVPSSSWTPSDIVALGAEPTLPPEVAGLFYVGKNHLLSGESEAGKTWLALAAVADELNAGRGVLWVDADDVGAGDLLERLRSLEVADDVIARLFAYVLPDDGLSEGDLLELVAALERRSARLAIFDGFNPLLGLHGLDPNTGVDVERLYQLLDPIRKAGCASVWTDNVVKSKEARGAWAIGSERKKSKAEVHLGVRALEQFGRNRTGKARLDVFKDRPGHLRASPPGLFVLTSDGERCSWQFEDDHSHDEQGAFRPTRLMEKVSRYLEQWGEPQSRNAIEQAVIGNAQAKRLAIERLIAEGYALESQGPRGARPVQSVRPFREENEE
jgi:AAA domain